MHLDIDKGTVIFAPLERMSRIGMFLVKTVWSSAVREENHDLMNRFRVLGEVVLS